MVLSVGSSMYGCMDGCIGALLGVGDCCVLMIGVVCYVLVYALSLSMIDWC